MYNSISYFDIIGSRTRRKVYPRVKFAEYQKCPMKRGWAFPKTYFLKIAV